MELQVCPKTIASICNDADGDPVRSQVNCNASRLRENQAAETAGIEETIGDEVRARHIYEWMMKWRLLMIDSTYMKL